MPSELSLLARAEAYRCGKMRLLSTRRQPCVPVSPEKRHRKDGVNQRVWPWVWHRESAFTRHCGFFFFFPSHLSFSDLFRMSNNGHLRRYDIRPPGEAASAVTAARGNGEPIILLRLQDTTADDFHTSSSFTTRGSRTSLGFCIVLKQEPAGNPHPPHILSILFGSYFDIPPSLASRPWNTGLLGTPFYNLARLAPPSPGDVAST